MPTFLLFILFVVCTIGAIWGQTTKRNPATVLACAFFAGYNLAFFITKVFPV